VTARRGLVWPLILIFVGVVFLLVNFGLIPPVSVFALMSLWPLILVMVGIDIAFGRRWPLAALGTNVAIVAASVALIAYGTVSPFGFGPFVAFGSGTPGVRSIDLPRAEQKTMSLRVSAGAARLELKGGATSLVHAESDQEDLRVRDTSRTTDKAEIRVDQGPSATGGFRIGPTNASRVTMNIASDVATSLTVDGGAGEFVIDARDMRLTDAKVSVGAASLVLTLPQPTGDVAFSISAGASSIIVEVPDTVEARITTSGGLTSTHRQNARFDGSETSGYATATNRVTVRISAGATSIVIR
jgi:hypothetical protein